MNIKVYKNREAHQIDNDVYGTQNENNVTELKIEVPEQYENWNKRIVFLTDEGNFWDYIKDNTYTIKNSITKYDELEAYIWLTENAESTETEETTEVTDTDVGSIEETTENVETVESVVE